MVLYNARPIFVVFLHFHQSSQPVHKAKKVSLTQNLGDNKKRHLIYNSALCSKFTFELISKGKNTHAKVPMQPLMLQIDAKRLG